MRHSTGKVYVADWNNRRIQIFTAEGENVWGGGGNYALLLVLPLTLVYQRPQLLSSLFVHLSGTVCDVIWKGGGGSRRVFISLWTSGG
jgi:hypothetical protein